VSPWEIRDLLPRFLSKEFLFLLVFALVQQCIYLTPGYVWFCPASIVRSDGYRPASSLCYSVHLSTVFWIWSEGLNETLKNSIQPSTFPDDLAEVPEIWDSNEWFFSSGLISFLTSKTIHKRFRRATTLEINPQWGFVLVLWLQLSWKSMVSSQYKYCSSRTWINWHFEGNDPFIVEYIGHLGKQRSG
jgi:hypothetical protein